MNIFRQTIIITTGLCSVSLLSAVSLTAQTTDPAFSLLLKPAAPGLAGTIDAVGVYARALALDAEAGQPLLTLQTVDENVQTVALSVRDLTAADASGPIPLSTRLDPATPDRPEQELWITGRAVHGPVSWNYLAPITNEPNPRGAAPPLELRSEDAAFSGQASTFLLLPVAFKPGPFQLRWDLSKLPAGAIAVSSLGIGDQSTTTPFSADDIRSIYLFAGLMRHYPDRPTAQGFFSAVQGTLPFDGVALLQWTERLYQFDTRFFHATDPHPYAVLLRRNLINAGGGVELNQAFIGTFDKQTDPEDLKLTISHEMVHTFAQGLDGDQFDQVFPRPVNHGCESDQVENPERADLPLVEFQAERLLGKMGSPPGEPDTEKKDACCG